jgi:hypothetical protein
MRKALVIALVLIWVIAGLADYAAQREEELVYRRGVCEDLWPDYKSLEVTCQ